MNGRTIITTAFLILLTSASAGAGQETPQDRLQAGIYAEEVQGNLEEAIAIYRSILRDYPENRAVGAKAQLHIGLCLEILGLNEAREAYQRVGLSLEDFEGPRFKRIGHVKQLLEDGRLDATLRWTTTAVEK